MDRFEAADSSSCHDHRFLPIGMGRSMVPGLSSHSAGEERPTMASIAYGKDIDSDSHQYRLRMLIYLMTSHRQFPQLVHSHDARTMNDHRCYIHIWTMPCSMRLLRGALPTSIRRSIRPTTVTRRTIVRSGRKHFSEFAVRRKVEKAVNRTDNHFL